MIRRRESLVRRSLGIEVCSCQDDRNFLTQTLQERSVVLNGQTGIVHFHIRTAFILVVRPRN
jgi:hypothetical protein